MRLDVYVHTRVQEVQLSLVHLFTETRAWVVLCSSDHLFFFFPPDSALN